jgi:hypothetical protein
VWFKTEWFLDRMDRVAARIKDTPPVDDLDVLIRLFVLQLPVTSKRFDETIPAELASSFEAILDTRGGWRLRLLSWSTTVFLSYRIL